MPEVKEHPQLFKAEMILAILAGLKTMTRRAVTQNNSLIDGTGEGIRKHWEHLEWDRAWVDSGPSPCGNPGPYWKVPCNRPGYCEDVVHRVYPRVFVGDSLWVKETWKLPAWNGDLESVGVCYRATGDKTHWIKRADHLELAQRLLGRTWRSPLHMPRRLVRLVLPVVRVGAERLQDITEMDARAEGHDWDDDPPPDGYGEEDRPTALGWFEYLWNSINGKRPGLAWKDNCPLWIYEWAPIK